MKDLHGKNQTASVAIDESINERIDKGLINSTEQGVCHQGKLAAPVLIVRSIR